jgi:hypothetical protein
MVGRRAHGQLKTTVLALLREADGPVTARMLLERWPAAEPPPAFTTVITVLTRLQQAGAVERIDGPEVRFRVEGPRPAAARGRRGSRVIVLAGLLALAAGSLLGAPRLLRLRPTAVRRPRLLLDLAVHLLVELAADDAAARICGAATLASALRRTAELEPNESASIGADRLEAAVPGARARAATGRRGLLYKL